MPIVEWGKPDPAEIPFKTNMIIGGSRAGKTHYCATYPRVAWIGATRERGWTTMQNMRRSDFYEPDRPPAIFHVASIAELRPYLDQHVLPRIARGEFRTLVLELSYYSEDVVKSLPVSEGNSWARYATLDEHVQWLDQLFKKMPQVRLVYNALTMDATDKGPAGPLIAGKAVAKKLPAATEFYAYLRAETTGTGAAVTTERVLHLTPHGPFQVGHRYGDRLPPLIRNPTFRKLEDLYHGRASIDAHGNVGYEAKSEMKPLPPLMAVPAKK
jgi:hypothetical protein